MSYVNVSTWSFPEPYDESVLVDRAADTMAALRAQGDVQAYMVKTSPTEVLFFMTFPDEVAYRRAAELLSARREGVLEAVGGTLTGDHKGDALVAL